MQIKVISKTPHSFNTKSNKTIIVKTPTKHKLINIKKRAKNQKCGGCKKSLHGILARRPSDFSRLKKKDKTVSRLKGGVYCGGCVKTIILKDALNN